MTLSPKRRLAGILVPVFAIRTETDLGVGDVSGVRQMIDWCHRHGLNLLQTLPINETGPGNSPYDAISAMAIDPVTIEISPRTIPELSGHDFNRIATPELLENLRQGEVNYAEVKRLKRRLLEAAFHRFPWDTSRHRAFSGFVKRNADWLYPYTHFRVLMEENPSGANWERWPAAQQSLESAAALIRSRPGLSSKACFFMYAQWLAWSQWTAARRYGERRGVFLMGDIPFGVARHSADVWANRSLFDLAWCGGAPPEKFFKLDAFTARWGQNWGIANYNWDAMRARGFDWWRQRVGNIGKVFHLCRFDHAPGFFRIYSFPWTPQQNEQFAGLGRKEAAALTSGRLPRFHPRSDNTKNNRAASQREGEAILRAIASGAEGMVIVAEDLGMVPDYMRATLRKLGMPGFRIPMFFREADGSYQNPKQYPRLSLAQPATHDHLPLAAAWTELWRQIDAGVSVNKNIKEQRRWLKFAAVKGPAPRDYTPELRDGYLRAVLRSNSWLAVVMITDVFGQATRFNTPGSVSAGNWSQRLPWTVKQMERDPALRVCARQFAASARHAKRGCR